MKKEKEVHDFFNGELQQILLPLEEFRVKNIRILRKNLIIGLCLFIIAFIFCFVLHPIFLPILLFPAFIFFGMAFQTLNKMINILQKNFKNKILIKLLEFLFHDFEYIPKQRIALTVFKKSKLFTNDISRAEGEDFMQFKLGESNIMFCESRVFKFGKDTNPIFKGIFISASFNKLFSSETIVIPKRNRFAIKIVFRRLFEGFKRIQLEDPEFNNEFVVYSTDQVESRYILTPSLMSRLLDYKFKVKRKIAYSFIENRIYCCIPNSINLFEPVIFESLLDFDYIKKNYETLKLFTDIIEDLNLNLRIWTKK